MVRAPWRHGDTREQGSRTGRCGWITSFLRSFKFLVEDTDLWRPATARPGTLFSSEGARPASGSAFLIDAMQFDSRIDIQIA
jgi:hypothetical protein